MYIPKINQSASFDETLAFMQRFNFATIISNLNDRIEATPLPFVISSNLDQLLLSAHFAKANKQWQEIEGQEVLVIFAEPHAYVSPSHYDKAQNVPTWNYLAVHAYGKVRLVMEQVKAFQIIEDLIKSEEPEYLVQWAQLSSSYKNRMVRGIVAFEVEVTELQHKEKLSQNKHSTEQDRIIDTFSASNDTNIRLTGEYMEHFLKKDQ